MKTLKELLGDELYAQVMAKLGDVQVFLHEKSQTVVIDDGTMIPKHRFDEVNDSKKALQKQIDKYERDMVDLKTAAAGVPDLTARIDTMNRERDAEKVENAKMEKRLRAKFAIKEALIAVGVVRPSALETLALRFDPDTVELDADGKVKGFDALVKPFQEDPVFETFFGVDRMHGRTPAKDQVPDEWRDKNPFSKKTENLSEQIRIKRTDPKLYEILKAAAN